MSLRAVEVGIRIIGTTRQEDLKAVVAGILAVVAGLDDILQSIIDTQEGIGN